MTVQLKPRHDAYRGSGRLSAIFLLIALLTGSGLAHAGSFEGHWYGKGYQPSVRKTLEWLKINRPDGSYSVEFREYSNCQLGFVQREEGT
jgi:hypothetical protein